MREQTIAASSGGTAAVSNGKGSELNRSLGDRSPPANQLAPDVTAILASAGRAVGTDVAGVLKEALSWEGKALPPKRLKKVSGGGAASHSAASASPDKGDGKPAIKCKAPIKPAAAASGSGNAAPGKPVAPQAKAAGATLGHIQTVITGDQVMATVASMGPDRKRAEKLYYDQVWFVVTTTAAHGADRWPPTLSKAVHEQLTEVARKHGTGVFHLPRGPPKANGEPGRVKGMPGQRMTMAPPVAEQLAAQGESPSGAGLKPEEYKMQGRTVIVKEAVLKTWLKKLLEQRAAEQQGGDNGKAEAATGGAVRKGRDKGGAAAKGASVAQDQDDKAAAAAEARRSRARRGAAAAAGKSLFAAQEKQRRR